MSVVREHEEFVWLHSVIEESENYGGFIVRLNAIDIIKIFRTDGFSNFSEFSRSLKIFFNSLFSMILNCESRIIEIYCEVIFKKIYPICPEKVN